MKSLAIALCLLVPAGTAGAQSVYEIPASSQPATSPFWPREIEAEEKPHGWIWWTVGLAIVPGIAVAIANSQHRGGGPHKSGY